MSIDLIGVASDALHPAAAAATTLLQRRPLDRLLAALRAVAPHLSDSDCAEWSAALAEPMQRAGIVTPRCIAAFLGQCSVESGGFTLLEENLHYSAARICQVWPARFPTLADAEACTANPEALANRVYADRLGNSGPDSGDGWRYRGRGLIQITGRSAYERFAQAMGLTLEQAVEHAATRQGAADSAVWFWSVNRLNALAASWSLDIITKRVNGGTLGADERRRLANAALLAIGV